MTDEPMFISRLTFRRDPGSIGAIVKLLSEGLDTDRAHHLLWTLFADSKDRRRDFVFRRGTGPRSADGDFLIVSARPPRDAVGLWQIECKPYDPFVAKGDVLAFKLRANPTVTRDGKRHDVVMDRKRRLGARRETTNAEIWEAAGREWLSARAARLGIELTACRADGYRVHRVSRRDSSPVSVAALDLSGVASVVDAERLRAALFTGVGHGKAWGCGLLLVRPR